MAQYMRVYKKYVFRYIHYLWYMIIWLYWVVYSGGSRESEIIWPYYELFMESQIKWICLKGILGSIWWVEGSQS